MEINRSPFLPDKPSLNAVDTDACVCVDWATLSEIHSLGMEPPLFTD